MKRTFALAIVASLLPCWMLAGCDLPESTPSTSLGLPPRELVVVAGDADELAAVTAVETARVAYRYRLEVLQSYYDRVGNRDRFEMAREELKNLDEAQTFRWSGVSKVEAPAGETVQNADERALVEEVVAARTAYKQAVAALRDLYNQKHIDFKAKMIANMQARLDPVRQYNYFFEAEIPGPELRPRAMSTEANALYEKGMKLYKEGKPLPLVTDYKKEREALHTFITLINEYPDSDKIARAAYRIAEIYKEYFNEDTRAVVWYERAWQWEPSIPEPAHFQAAVVYDYRLQNKAKALECYRASLKNDPNRVGNYDHALKRIQELSGKGE